MISRRRSRGFATLLGMNGAHLIIGGESSAPGVLLISMWGCHGMFLHGD